MQPDFDSTASAGASAAGFSPLGWTDERVAAMWSFYAATEANSYFAAQFGAPLIEAARTHLPAEGLVADYGCGRGQVARALAETHPVLAIDFEETLSQIRPALAATPTTHPITFATPDDVGAHAGAANAVFFIETIEHLLPSWIEPTFANLRNLLRPGGIIFCSTPNEEDVAKAMVCCPSCRNYFHKYQHMRVFSAETLAAFMEAQGFETIEVEAHNFGMTTPYARTRQAIRRLLGREQRPHLLYIGRRRSDD